MAPPGSDTDDPMQARLDDMFSRFQKENKELLLSIHATIRDVVHKEFSTLFDRLEEQQARIMDLETENRSQAQEIMHLKSSVDDHKRLVDHLRQSTDDLEQYSRRNCLQFFGVAELPNETTDDLICNIAKEKLKLDISTKDIDRSHRIGDPSKPPTRRKGKVWPRPIIVKFVSYRTRHAVISQRRALKGTGIVIQEDLTKTKQKLLNAVLKKDTVQTAWSSDGRVIAKIRATNGKTVNKVIRCIADLDAL